MSAGDPPPRAAARRTSATFEQAPGDRREPLPSRAGANGPPTPEHTTGVSTARDAALALVSTLYDLREVGRAAEPFSEDHHIMIELGRRLVGDDDRGGSRAQLERTLSHCRDALTPLLPRLIVSRQSHQRRLFDLEGTPYPTATHGLLDRAEQTLSRLGTLNRGWSRRAVSNVCERLFGVLRSDPAGGQIRSVGTLPADTLRIRAEIEAEFAPLLVAEAERPHALASDADGPYRHSAIDFGVRWRGRDIPFDRTEERGWEVVGMMWPPEQGKRLRAEEAKAKIGSKARNPKWAVNVASRANSVLGKYLFFPFKLTGVKDEGVEFLQWDEVSAGTL